MTNSLSGASLAPGQLSQQITTAVASKTLQAARQEGASVLQLLANAAPPAQTSSDGVQAGDPLVAKATGLGSLLDLLA